MTSQIRSRVESVIRNDNIMVLILYSNLFFTLTLLADFQYNLMIIQK